MRKTFVLISVGVLAGVAAVAWFWPPVLWTLVVVVPLIGVGVMDMTQSPRFPRRFGAAPMEFSDFVGTPLNEGLSFVHNALIESQVTGNPAHVWKTASPDHF